MAGCRQKLAPCLQLYGIIVIYNTTNGQQMSNNLPAIDAEKVARNLSAKLGEKEYELSSMKTLAEALLGERDSYKAQLDEALQRLSQIESAEPVENITTLK